jgi:hypothetical protein
VRAQPQDDNLAEVTRMLAGLEYPELPQAVHARIERALAGEGVGRLSGRSPLNADGQKHPQLHQPAARLRD